MTEEEWLACDAQQRLRELRKSVSERKLRLFAVACCRRIDHLFLPKYRKAVDLAERYADGTAPEAEIATFRERADEDWNCDRGVEFYIQLAATDVTRCRALEAMCTPAFEAADHCLVFTNDAESHAAALAGNEDDGRATCQSLRPIEVELVVEHFGNPFRPVAFDHAWRTSDVITLARDIYNDSAFDRMPILADALQDAGCDNADILSHCRDTAAPHARGCWVVDRVLGKE